VVKEGVIRAVHSLKKKIASIKDAIRPCTTGEREEKKGEIVSAADEVIHPSKTQKSVQTLGVSAISREIKHRGKKSIKRCEKKEDLHGGVKDRGGVEAEQKSSP